MVETSYRRFSCPVVGPLHTVSVQRNVSGVVPPPCPTLWYRKSNEIGTVRHQSCVTLFFTHRCLPPSVGNPYLRQDFSQDNEHWLSTGECGVL